MAANNSEEIFDVVNDRDEVTGQAPRSEVHRQGLLHRAVHILVFNQQGQLFLQKRSMQKDCFPGAWDSSAAGHLDQGEDYDACALRELREEIGLELSATPEKLFKIDACPETGQEFVWIYRCTHEGPFTLCPNEIETGAWFTPAYLSAWIKTRPHDFAPSLIKIWQQLQGAKP